MNHWDSDIADVLAGRKRWTVITADCLAVLPTIPAGSIDAVIVDPPYSSGGAFRSDRTQKTVAKYVNTDSVETCRIDFSGDNRDQRSFLAWASMWLAACHTASRDGAVICCFTDWRQLPTLTDAIQCGGWVWRNIGTWWKPGIRMQRGRFSSSAEYVVYGSKGVPTDGELSPQNVYSFAPISGEDKEHVAEKPAEVLSWMTGVTTPASVILDPFTGSGSAGVAAMRMGRRFIGVEAIPEYAAIARRRIAEAANHLFAGSNQ